MNVYVLLVITALVLLATAAGMRVLVLDGMHVGVHVISLHVVLALNGMHVGKRM